MPKRAWSRPLSLAVLLAAWLLLAPTQLGGSASYVVVAGSSMDPEFREGDLVVLRQAQRYAVGDVAAYRSAELGALVLHRIVDREAGRFVLRGDNNAFVDPVRPRASDFLGRPWFVVPGAGPVLSWIRQPTNAAALSALVVLLALGLVDARRDRLPRRLGIPSDSVLAATAGVGAGCLLLAFFAFAQPATQRVPGGPPLYEHRASFGYEARVRPSAAYPEGVVRGPDPVFLRLVPNVSVWFDYRLRSAETSRISGTARLAVEVRGANDWRRTVLLAPSRPFVGDGVVLQGRLGLRELRDLAARVERLTGTRSDSYELTVVPRVEVRGTVGHREVAETFAPRLALRLDPLELRVDRGRPGNALYRSRPREAIQEVPNALTLPGLRLGVEHARLALVPGIVLILVAALLWLARVCDPRARAARIRGRYGPWLVDVAPRPHPVSVEVLSMEDLARLAEQNGRAILHEEREGGHWYVVEEGERAYVYAVPEETEERAATTVLAAR